MKFLFAVTVSSRKCGAQNDKIKNNTETNVHTSLVKKKPVSSICDLTFAAKAALVLFAKLLADWAVERWAV